MKTFEHTVTLYLRFRILDRDQLPEEAYENGRPLTVEEFATKTNFNMTHDNWDKEATDREIVNPGVYIIRSIQQHEPNQIVSKDEMVFQLRRTSYCEIVCEPDKEYLYYQDAKKKLEDGAFAIQQRINEQIKHAMLMSDPVAAMAFMMGKVFVLPLEKAISIGIFYVDSQTTDPFTEEEKAVRPYTLDFKQYKVYKLTSATEVPKDSIGATEALSMILTYGDKIVLSGDWQHNRVDVLLMGFMDGIRFMKHEVKVVSYDVVVDSDNLLSDDDDSAWWHGLYEGQKYPPAVAPIHFEQSREQN